MAKKDNSPKFASTAPVKSSGKTSRYGKKSSIKAGSRQTGYSWLTNLGRIKGVNILLLLILAAISAIVLIGPFYRGLFFQKELIPVHVLCFALFGLWWVSKMVRRDGAFLQTPLEWCILALVFFYLLSIFGAVNRRAALAEFLKVANYFVIYLMVADICRQRGLFSLLRPSSKPVQHPASRTPESEQSRSGKAFSFLKRGQAFFQDRPFDNKEQQPPVLIIFLHILLASGVAVAVGGLGTAAGTWDLHGAFMDGRITTPLQYANTGAAYVMTAYFLALGLAFSLSRWYLRPLYLGPSAFLLLAFIFTYSRGAWLVMPLLGVLFILLSPRGNRVRTFLYLSVSAVALLPFLFPLNSALKEGLPGEAWAYMSATALLMLLGGYIAEYLVRLHPKVKIALGSTAVVLLLLAGGYLLISELNKPIQLQTPPTGPPVERYLEERIGNIRGGEEYNLSLEINAVAAEAELSLEENPDAYAWRLLILAYDLDDNSTVLLDRREGATDGWEKRNFSFVTEEEHKRMEIRFYNHFPGTGFILRQALLANGDDDKAAELNFFISRILPDSVYTGIFSREKSVDLRIAHYRDAFKIIRDYPLLGTGGGGWSSLYQSYQDQRYFTTEVHNHYLQVWVEAGIFAFLAFVGMWLFFILSFGRNFFSPQFSSQAQSAESFLRLAVFLPAISLALHSAIDFNLSLGVVSIFLFALLGVGRSLLGEREENFWNAFFPLRRFFSQNPWFVGVIGIITSFIFFMYSFTLWQGFQAADRASAYIKGQNLEAATKFLRDAVEKDPLEPTNYANLSRLYLHMSEFKENEQIAPQMQREALEMARRAYELEPYNVGYNMDYGALLLRHGQLEEGLEKVGRIIELQPFQEGNYLQVAGAYLLVADYYLKNDENKESGQISSAASLYLHKIFDLQDKMEQRCGHAVPLYFSLGRAALLLEDYPAAENYLTRVQENDRSYQDALKHLLYLYQKTERWEEAAQIQEKVSQGESE